MIFFFLFFILFLAVSSAVFSKNKMFPVANAQTTVFCNNRPNSNIVYIDRVNSRKPSANITNRINRYYCERNRNSGFNHLMNRSRRLRPSTVRGEFKARAPRNDDAITEFLGLLLLFFFISDFFFSSCSICKCSLNAVIYVH